jgi:magnesium chelatase family protein
MATNPCPCGNYGSKDKVCLCSAKSIEQYWKKFSEPLLDRVAIHYNCNRGVAFVGSNLLSLGTDEAELRDSVKRAVLRQLEEQGKYNQDLTHDELQKKMVLLTNAAKAVLDNATANNNLSATTKDEVVKLAFTIRDMRSIQRCGVWSDDIELALKLHGGKIIDFTE